MAEINANPDINIDQEGESGGGSSGSTTNYNAKNRNGSDSGKVIDPSKFIYKNLPTLPTGEKGIFTLEDTEQFPFVKIDSVYYVNDGREWGYYSGNNTASLMSIKFCYLRENESFCNLLDFMKYKKNIQEQDYQSITRNDEGINWTWQYNVPHYQIDGYNLNAWGFINERELKEYEDNEGYQYKKGVIYGQNTSKKAYDFNFIKNRPLEQYINYFNKILYNDNFLNDFIWKDENGLILYTTSDNKETKEITIGENERIIYYGRPIYSGIFLDSNNLSISMSGFTDTPTSSYWTYTIWTDDIKINANIVGSVKGSEKYENLDNYIAKDITDIIKNIEKGEELSISSLRERLINIPNSNLKNIKDIFVLKNYSFKQQDSNERSLKSLTRKWKNGNQNYEFKWYPSVAGIYLNLAVSFPSFKAYTILDDQNSNEITKIDVFKTTNIQNTISNSEYDTINDIDPTIYINTFYSFSSPGNLIGKQYVKTSSSNNIKIVEKGNQMFQTIQSSGISQTPTAFVYNYVWKSPYGGNVCNFYIDTTAGVFANNGSSSPHAIIKWKIDPED